MVAIRFVAAIIWIGIFLGMMDCLVDVTKYMGKQAAQAHPSPETKDDDDML